MRSYYTRSSLNDRLHYGSGMVDWLNMEGKLPVLAVPRRLDRSSFCIRSTPLLASPPLRSIFIFKKLTHQNDELSVLWEMLHTKMMTRGFENGKKD